MNVNEKKQALDLQATITVQAQTIKKLSDALEYVLAIAYWSSDLTEYERKKAAEAARALLAEIRGAK